MSYDADQGETFIAFQAEYATPEGPRWTTARTIVYAVDAALGLADLATPTGRVRGIVWGEPVSAAELTTIALGEREEP